MSENTKHSTPETWLWCFHWIVFLSESWLLILKLHCKDKSKSDIVCWFGTKEVHRGSGKYVQRYYSLAAQTGAPAGIHPWEQWNVPVLRAGYTVLIEKPALPSIFRMIPFLFRAPLLWKVLRKWTTAWSGGGKIRYGFDLSRSQESGAADSDRGAILIFVWNGGCGVPAHGNSLFFLLVSTAGAGAVPLKLTKGDVSLWKAKVCCLGISWLQRSLNSPGNALFQQPGSCNHLSDDLLLPASSPGLGRAGQPCLPTGERRLIASLDFAGTRANKISSLPKIPKTAQELQSLLWICETQ